MLRAVIRLICLALLVTTLLAVPAMAGRGGRGGGGFGGGGMRGGGFSGGGMRAMPGGGGMRGGGGGFSHSPSFSPPRQMSRPTAPGGNFGGSGRPGGMPGGPQSGLGGSGRPGYQPGGPSLGGGRSPGTSGGPQLGGNRPSTLPAGPGISSRPGVGQPGLGNRPGIDNRPGVGQPGLGNRPGIDNRPGVGQPGLGNRPGIDNRPGVGQPGLGNRPGIDNRPITGGGNTIVGGGNIIAGGVRPVDPGYGVRGPVADRWRGAYGDYHRGWVNGYWHGYHANPGWNWNWASFGVGVATGVAGWGLGSAYYDWGYLPYTNPYYVESGPAVGEQPVAVGGDAVVAAYDYSQPIDTQAPPPEPTVAEQATATFDSAREVFKAGDYAQALQLADQALTKLPNDATLHEFRALCLFALGRYEEAAVPIYAILSVGPGWDWTTLVGLYPTVDVYTQQIRALESSIQADPDNPAKRFVLAYHYITQNHTDAAVGQLKKVVELSPQDTLAAQLVKQISGADQESAPAAQPAQAAVPPAEAPVEPGQLPGSWTASPAPDAKIDLVLANDKTFTWNLTGKGRSQKISGEWSLTGNVLTLAQKAPGNALVGQVTWSAPDRFNFRAVGTVADDPGLTFHPARAEGGQSR